MPEQASQTNTTSVTFEIGSAVSLTPWQDRRGHVYAVVPTSGVTPEPPQMYGPELNGGQMPAALAVWDRAIAEATAAEETRLMELQMPPALVLDDVLPPQTIGTAFIGPGVPGGR
jgi:hypothetical protein